MLNANTINRGVGGSAIVSKQHNYWYGSPMWGDFYIDLEIVDIDPFWYWSHGAATYLNRPAYSPFPKFDTVILAWGTNDLNAYGYSPNDVIKAIKKARRKFLAYGADVYVATVPAIYEWDGTKSPTMDPNIQKLNRKIRGNFPKRYIEFYEGFTWSDYADRLHLNADGHEKRALAALEALSR
jgi:lysophospholipase L1-like esterase